MGAEDSEALQRVVLAVKKLLPLPNLCIRAGGHHHHCATQSETSYHRKFPPEQCPSEWIGYKKKCYFISEEEKNWTSSQTFCAKNESLLAVFENEEEMRSLAKRLNIDDSWIGLRKKGENFYWENGIALKAHLFQIRNHSECAYLDTFTISTSACSLPRRWICIRLP
ncbi:C-type lectin domain family 2 member L-like isoform 2-T3 [Phoenicopterus ruber ruber]